MDVCEMWLLGFPGIKPCVQRCPEAVVPTGLTRLMLSYFQNLSELKECFFSSCCLELYFWVVSHRILHTAVLVQPISAEHLK